MTKKIIVIFTALLLTASFCACSGGKGNGETSATSSDTVNIESSTTSESATDEETGTGSTNTPSSEVDYPEAYSYDEVNETVYVISPVNLHDLENYDEKFSVVAGTELKRVGISKDAVYNGYWSKVVYNDVTYYVASSYLTTLKNADEGFVEVTKTVVLKTAALNIRMLPEMGNNVVGHFNAGDEITVIAENTTTGWYKVEFVKVGDTEKSVGYIASNPEFFETEASAETTDAE